MILGGKWLLAALAVVAIYLGWVFVKRQEPLAGSSKGAQTKAVPVLDLTGGSSAVKILNFYARETVVTEGTGTVLCYGVVNAKSVRVEPPVDGVSPAITRCVEVRPKRETQYTLIAEGSDGKSVSQSVSVAVGADATQLPKINYFKVTSCKRDYTGDAVFSVVFADQNAEEVSIDPPAFPPLHGSPMGEFSVKVGKVATYTLSVKGKFGRVATRALVLDPASCK